MPRMDSAAETDSPAEMWLSSPNPPWKYSTSAGTWQGRFQRHDMIRLGSGDGPLSVRGCPPPSRAPEDHLTRKLGSGGRAAANLDLRTARSSATEAMLHGHERTLLVTQRLQAPRRPVGIWAGQSTRNHGEETTTRPGTMTLPWPGYADSIRHPKREMTVSTCNAAERKAGVFEAGDIREWRGHDVVDSDGHKIGELEAIYVDTSTDLPAFATVTVGMPTRHRLVFVPLAHATVGPGYLKVAHDRKQVKDSPSIRNLSTCPRHR